ncbi:Nuclease subunit of the excinuclease complex [Picosynechococcus sp. PCC 7003]|uniref:GIY-YIG nuclease family protein n=1 Tax=Picosynechococcus sp. PCC 7003 TaxID=374981 RepID=UPI0008106096|nr:GIY-YIG nuclease family protein [Picosynechococcus sp. PCC 7003]ANV83933.1 Nuclease subunit of the excinuclease complex [Picosynechococcus sp. PCC 7003]
MSLPKLAALDFLPYIDAEGLICPAFNGKLGLYGIFDANQTLCYVGYSRDVSKSLQQHLVRCPEQCHWVKVFLGDRPSRTLLEEMRAAWLTENGTIPPGNGEAKSLWTQPIDIKQDLQPAEQETLQQSTELEMVKHLKNYARQREAAIKDYLIGRGLKTDLRFQPKLKEQGLLDLK